MRFGTIVTCPAVRRDLAKLGYNLSPIKIGEAFLILTHLMNEHMIEPGIGELPDSIQMLFRVGAADDAGPISPSVSRLASSS
jgi:hypothetical protein